MRLWQVSAAYTFPAVSIATPVGWQRLASKAGPPSPKSFPAEPLPANRLTRPEVSIFQICMRLVKLMYTFPALSDASPETVDRLVCNAGKLRGPPPRIVVRFCATAVEQQKHKSVLTKLFTVEF